ncbi:MAG TPA: aminopeptidase P family protein [Verrucomicrobiales bacterium]|nr:aminopeptidase P family protein [Verrucomicrobiales bacterium]
MSDDLLMVADSERDADMLYAVGMFVPDPFVYLRIRGRPLIILSDLEVDRGRREAPHCRVISHSDVVRRLEREGVRHPDMAQVIRWVLSDRGVRRVTVPASFPLGLACRLKKIGLKVKPRQGELFPEREIKRADEVKKISAALTMAEVGLAEGIHAIKNSRVGRGRRLMYRNSPLTSERLQGIIAAAVMQVGGIAANTIAAGGAQTCDPHERGQGVLHAGEPIILDVFPRSQKTGFFGDITRTVVKGRASDAVRGLYRTVEEAQDLAFSLIRSGAVGGDIHAQVQAHFIAAGYKTRRAQGRMQGFFHGTGHGLGLDLHERLRLGTHSPHKLKAGQVVTVEPGLYYSGIGGVRLEDVALVTRTGGKNLTRFEKVLEV